MLPTELQAWVLGGNIITVNYVKGCILTSNLNFTFEDHFILCYHPQVKIWFISFVCDQIPLFTPEYFEYLD